MTRTVLCPECRRAARVVDSFTVQRSTGSVRFLRVQCDGPLSFLVNVGEGWITEISSKRATPSTVDGVA